MTVWHDVPGCAGIRASEDGQIINAPKGRLLKQRAHKSGAMQVHVGGKTRMVHDLVARAFYGQPIVKGYRVKHLNGNKGDNHIGNLVWTSSAVAEKVPHQSPTIDTELEHAYESARLDRLALIELMQS